MRRQATTLIVSAFFALVLAVIGTQLPAPYVRLVPGPVTDTLGVVGGKPLIVVKGHATSQTKGRIYLVTVSEFGGPGKNITGADVLSGWWSKSDAVVPRRILFPPHVTQQEVARQDAQDMANSQEQAKVAALRFLGYSLKPGVDVAAVTATSSAKGKLHVDDIIVGIDGKAVANSQALLTALKSHKAGDQITLEVNRNGVQVEVPVALQKPPAGRQDQVTPTIGIEIVDSFAKPFEINIDLRDVGGPSAGAAFALGIVDKLSGDDLTGGRTIAVTGTIDAQGNVGAIGGVVQKMWGARRAGATVFFVPKDNCAEAVKSVPGGLRLVMETTLAKNIDALKQLQAGGSNLPSCPG